jgi:hypothetical protein
VAGRSGWCNAADVIAARANANELGVKNCSAVPTTLPVRTEWAPQLSWPQPRCEEWGNNHGQRTAFDPHSTRRLPCCRDRCRAFVSGWGNGLSVDVAEARGPPLANEVTVRRNIFVSPCCGSIASDQCSQRLRRMSALPPIATNFSWAGRPNLVLSLSEIVPDCRWRAATVHKPDRFRPAPVL